MNQIIIATTMRPTGETGVQTHFNTYCDYLISLHISHTLITPFSYSKILVYPIFAVRRILDCINDTCSLWWYRYWHRFFLHLALRKQLASNTECIIYAQCPLAAQAALDARVSSRQKVVLVAHFNISQADEWVGKGKIKAGSRYYQAIQQFESTTLPKLDGLVFLSQFMQSELNRRIPAIKKLSSAIIPNFLADPKQNKSEIVSDLINIGSLEPRKNQVYLLEIISELRNMGSPLSLTVIGDGPDRASLEEKAKLLEITDLVHFTGFLKNAAKQIESHKACIHVALIENLPITLLEAIARGRPIFASAVGGIPEIMGDDEVGLTIPLNDAKSAAQMIAKAINDPIWVQSKSDNARNRFLNHYSSDISAKKLTEFLLAVDQST